MKAETLLAAVVGVSLVVVVAVWTGQSGPTIAPVVRPSEDRPAVSETGPHPRIQVDEPLHNFGFMEPQDEKSHTFVVRNTGDAPLILQKGKASCRCAGFELSTNEVPVGGEATVDMRWRPGSEMSPFEQHVIVYTNDPNRTEVRLSITGGVAAAVQVSPSSPWDFGSLAGTEPAKLKIYIYSTGLDQFEPPDVEVESSHVTSDVVPLKSHELLDVGTAFVRSGYRVEFSIAPDIPLGPYRQDVAFRLKLPNRERVMRGEITGLRRGPYHLLPVGSSVFWHAKQNLLDFGEFPADEGKSARFHFFLLGAAAQDGTLELTSSSPRFLEVSLERDEGFKSETRARFLLDVKIPPGSPVGPRRGDRAGRITVKTNIPELPELHFQVVYVSI